MEIYLKVGLPAIQCPSMPIQCMGNAVSTYMWLVGFIVNDARCEYSNYLNIPYMAFED